MKPRDNYIKILVNFQFLATQAQFLAGFVHYQALLPEAMWTLVGLVFTSFPTELTTLPAPNKRGEFLRYSILDKNQYSRNFNSSYLGPMA